MTTKTQTKAYRVTKIQQVAGGGIRTYTHEGTLPELLEIYRHSLEAGQSWEHEKGNKKINTNPRTIKSLCTALTNSANNVAINGYGGADYTYEEI